ncbi:MAG: carboxylesterase family protein [Alphaproteobacteria bacterium]|nr:carboxylesterase family protein [Alphaproteobacteria bacterium]
MSLRQTREGLGVVATESGLVCGSGEAIRVYKGIPFAAAPVGQRRWRPPELVVPWKGVREATTFAADCPQEMRPGSRAGRTDEDCLALNIWTPARSADEALPVMVWFYGGSFVFGSASDIRFDGEGFARKGVVLVTAAYRVGLFGYLAHPELSRESPHGSSGNYGLLDQIAALGWIQRNIAAFGGDPGRVTAFGVSAGSASIALLLTSALAGGLFQRAILESPGAFRPLAPLADAERAGLALGSDIARLRQMPAAELLAKTDLLVPKVRGLTTPRILRPIRDGWVVRENERDAFQAGRFHAMPMIVGGNADEGATLTAAWPMRTPDDLRALMATSFPNATDRANALYPAAYDGEVRRRVAEVFADTQFNYGVWRLAQANSLRCAQTWRYQFLRRRAGRQDGPNHGEEVSYVFDTLGLAPAGQEAAPFDSVDARIATAMQDAWVRFAASGDPNGEGLPTWPRYRADEDRHLEFDDVIRAGASWRRRQMDFVEDYYAGQDDAQ